jgi:hypothetical protein
MTLRIAYEPDSVNLVGATWETSTTTTFRETTWTSAVVLATRGGGVREYSFTFTAMSDFWFRGLWAYSNFNNSEQEAIVTFKKGSTNQFRVAPDGALNPQVFYVWRWNGSSWVKLDTTPIKLLNGPNYHVVCHVEVNASTGRFRLYINDAKVYDFTGNVSGPDADCDTCVIGSTRSTNTVQYWSQIAVASFNLLGTRVIDLHPTAAGTYSEWTGAYTAIDETDRSLADSVDTNAATQRFLYNLTNSTAGQQTGKVILGVAVSMRTVLETGSTPTNIEAMVRIGGTDYTSGNLGLGAVDTDTYQQYVWELNPNTSGAWSFSDIDALEAGFKSV